MNRTLLRLKWNETLAIMLLCQFAACLVILLDIPIAKQVIGFLYFGIVPGYVIVRLLKLEGIGKVETAIFSIGFSVAFLMLGGLLTNEICLWLGVSRPLSEGPLLLTLNSLALIGEILLYFRSDDARFYIGKIRDLHPSTWFVIVLPILSIAGAMCVYAFGSNLMLLTMIPAIALVLIVGVMSKQIPTKFYPLALLMITISLLFSSTLVSKNLINFGSDLSLEYSLCENTLNTASWSPISSSGFGRFDPMLSITILPTVYSNLLNMDLNSIFKILFPMLFSFVPLGLYQLWRENLGSKNAFMAVFLVVASETFYSEMLGLGRQMIAELFLVLLLLVVLNTKIRQSKRMISYTILATGLVMSHYAIAVIFAFFITAAYIFLAVTRRSRRSISLSMVMIFMVIMFSWYIFISGSAAFNNLLSYGNYVYDQLGQFFNIASRGETVLVGLGIESAPSIWNLISRIFGYLTEFLIAVGFIGLIIRRVGLNFEKEELILSSIAMAFLAALVIVPGLAQTFNMTRFYHILLFFIAPLCVLGAEFLTKLVVKHRREIWASALLLVVLIPFFLFQTSFVFEVVKSESWSLSLSGYRMTPIELNHFGYTKDQNVLSAYWMRTNVLIPQLPIYADRSSKALLISYGSIPLEDILPLSNVTIVSENGTLYLSSLNVINKTVIAPYYFCSLDQFTFLGDMNQVYSNGENEIYGSSRN